MSTVAGPQGTRRAFRHHRAQTVEWVNAAPSAAHVLAGLGDDTDRAYVLGPRPGSSAKGVRAWALDVPAGWAHDPRGHYLEGEGITLRYRRPDGRAVALYRAAAWYGPDDHSYNAHEARAAWRAAGDVIRAVFDPRAQLLATPATTGRELLLRAIPAGRSWPTMSDELQQLVRRTSGQGRIELLPARGAELPALVQLDGRLMYAALCWGLPGGEPVRSAGGDYLGQQRARYLVRVTVPRDWEHACACGAPGHAGIGLLGVPLDRAGWEYPSEPGRRFATWADGAELHVLYRHGWEPQIVERLAWPVSSVGPLDGWRRRLVRARGMLDGAHVVDQLAARAVRAVILHGLGSFHGARHRITRMAPAAEPERVPKHAHALRAEGDALVWHENAPAVWAAMSHPEWTAAVWARARARLLDGPGGTGALHVPAETVVAFRTDALYLTADPGWSDDGLPGRFRRKTRTEGPIPWPLTARDLLLRAGEGA